MKNVKKILSLILAVSMLTAAVPLAASAADGTMKVTLRVEGITENLFYETLDVPFTETLTVQDLILYADAQYDTLTVMGAEGASPYITDINGDTAGRFGGWDGWLFRINDVEPAAGINAIALSENDNVVFFYGDPHGVGMQYPKMDLSEMAKGLIRFTSNDTTYPEGLPVVTNNPVKDLKVIFDDDVNNPYVTDEEGKIKIDSEKTTNGEHTVKVKKISENGIPLALRLAPDEKVTVAVEGLPKTNPEQKKPEKSPNPNTSDVASAAIVISVIAAATLVIGEKRKLA